MKRIILLSDGTGNSAAKRHKTNVWRLYNALVLSPDRQVAMYDDGVGTQEFLLPRLLGSVFGYGLKTNVIQLYKFLCRNHEDGDKIYLFGFSRGAFTVRVLAGLIDRCGLCKGFTSEQDLHKAARANFAAYRKMNYKRRYFSKLLSWEEGCQCQETDDEGSCVGHKVEIEFIGVWDTVDAYGLPIDELRDLWDRFIYPLRFKSRKLGKKVKKACHAVSIDDERHTFHPVLWDESKEESESNRIEQVWFPGVHSDVGGGYPRHELALLSFDWMMSKAEMTGLLFRPELRCEYWRRADWNGIQHDSRAGLRAYYRYRPRDIEELWRKACSCNPPKIHRSAFERIKTPVVPYAPTGIPANYIIVSTHGSSPEFKENDKAEWRNSAMDCARDMILLRQCLYYMFLLTTVMAVAVPVIVASGNGAACTGATCLLGPLCCDLANALCELAKAFLPDFADIWIAGLCQMVCQNSKWFWVLIIIFPILLWVKMKASAWTFDRAEKAWFHVRHPNGCDASQSGNLAKCQTSATSFLRSPLGCKARNALRLTWWWLVFVAILVAIVLAAGRAIFYIRDCVGCI